MTPRRLVLSAGLAAAVTLPGFAGIALPATADVTVPTILPTPTTTTQVTVPEVSVPVVSSVVTTPAPAPLTAATISSLGTGGTGTGGTGTGGTGTGGTGLPRINPEALPSVPGAPSLPLPSLPGNGGQPQPPSSGGGGAQQDSPLGDDVLPEALEQELCTVLTTLLGPLPAQLKGVPAAVIGQLPRQITDQVPADVLRTVTLRCPATADTPAAPTPATTPAAAQAPAAQTRVKGTKTGRAARAERTGLSSLPHTGALAGLPIAALALLVLGAVVRGRARE